MACTVSHLPAFPIVHDTGMKCGGCVGHVKQLLEQHAAVSAATVNLATETALVRVKLEAGADLSTLAAELAKVRNGHCGVASCATRLVAMWGCFL